MTRTLDLGTTGVVPFTLAVPETEIVDLRRRLDNTRWSDRETIDGWSQGTPLDKVQALCRYWRNEYDWRRCERHLNQLGQFKTEIDGLGIHFLHVRSPCPNAIPILMTHGWPGSVIEFLKVIKPLTDPMAFGGKAEDAFHLVMPSLPGYGFSDKPTEKGWNLDRIARAWIALMARLGYSRWFAQGGDWGAAVTTEIGKIKPPNCAAIHVTFPLAFPNEEDMAHLTPAEAATLESLNRHQREDSGYSKQQSTRPQSMGYGLVDSPAALAAWIYEKLWFWADNSDKSESVFSLDEILDNVMLYWLPATGTSSARLYWEAFNLTSVNVDIPVGVSIFPKEVYCASRRWVSRYMPNLFYWNELDRGGHFAAWEQPELFVEEMRHCFRAMRQRS
jgi:epoxide hydrolase